MSEKIETANTSEAGNDPVISQDGEKNNADTVNNNSDGASSNGNSASGTQTDAAKKQSREQNTEFARRRRKAEQQKAINKAREEARVEATVKALGGKNPFTGEEIKDATDIEEYFLMREIEEAGGDPITDYHKHYKEKLRQGAQRAEDTRKSDEWYDNDREAFISEHPEVNLHELIANERFNLFAKGKVGEMPLSEIYEGFISFMNDSEAKAKQMAAQMVANQNASVGSVTGDNGNQGNDFFTKDEVKKMSKAEINKNYEKIQQSMKKWK